MTVTIKIEAIVCKHCGKDQPKPPKPVELTAEESAELEEKRRERKRKDKMNAIIIVVVVIIIYGALVLYGIYGLN